MKRTVIAMALAIACAGTIMAREPRRSDTVGLASPLDIPLSLAGNFAELRKSHFHSGIDFKTQGRIGFPVHSAADGYVSRVSVSPWGFGRAVYVTHPSLGLTTVYGHLDGFAKNIDAKVRGIQYDRETFTIDLSFGPEEFPVKKGDVIGISGNAGSSGGPHVHMDVRDAESEDPLDVLEYYRDRITDDQAPEVRQLALFAADGGIVNGSTTDPAYLAPAEFAKGFTAWGRVYPGIKAYDRMTGTSNIYGVKYLTLTVDGDTVYNRVLDRFSFDTTKAIHTLVHYPGVVESGSWVMVTRVPDSAPLGNMISAKDRGVITIDEERPYNLEWILRDEHGNVTRRKVTIKGERTAVPASVASGNLMYWNMENSLDGEDYSVTVPEASLYDNAFVEVVASEPPAGDYYSRQIKVGDSGVPLDKGFELSLKIQNDTLANKDQYCLLRIDGKRRSAETSSYGEGGWIYASPSSFGRFVVGVDKVAPTITPLNRQRWKSGVISLKITDNLSGVQSYRVEIDGRFALFELDGKTSTITFKMDHERFGRGSHKMKVMVEDACGNRSEEEYSF